MAGGIGTAAVLRVGVIGLGMIGGGIAQCIARRGRPLSVHDVRPDAVEKLAGVPPLATSPAAVARESDVVIVAVVDAAQALDVLSGMNGILDGVHPALIVVLVSTVAVTVVRELAEVASQRGVTLIDAGVTGGDKAAAGGLVAMVGGETSTVETVRPVLEEFCQLVLHMGPLGSGMAAKLARNVVTYGCWRIAYEAGLLAEQAGVSLQKLVQAVRTSDPDGGLTTFWLQRGSVGALPLEADYARTAATSVANLMRKDLEAALALAYELDVAIPAAAAALAGTEQTLGLGCRK